MGYTKQNFKNGQTLDAEHLIKMEDAILACEDSIANLPTTEGSGSSDCHITYLSSDTTNMINLRDLASGTYVLYGKFRPYAESTATLSFASELLVNVITKTAGTHVQVFYPVNNCVQFLNITDDSYERTNVYLNNLVEYIGTLSDLTTEEKTNLVGAINEVKTLAESVSVTTTSIENALGYTPANPNRLSLGVHTDGLVYILVDNVPVGSGVEVGSDGDVTGYIDAENNITLTGTLANGTYKFRYKNADDTVTEIGTYTVGDTSPTYTNLFDPVAATLNQRWSNSSYAFTTSSGAGHVVSDYIAIPDISDSSIAHILRFRGGNWASAAGIIYYNSNKAVVQASDAGSNGVGVHATSDTPTTDENGDYQITLGHKNGVYDSAWANAAYIRITLQVNATSTEITTDDIQDIIITIDEPIVD